MVTLPWKSGPFRAAFVLIQACPLGPVVVFPLRRTNHVRGQSPPLSKMLYVALDARSSPAAFEAELCSEISGPIQIRLSLFGTLHNYL